MKVKLFDENHEQDLEEAINDFLSRKNIDLIDIKYQLSIMYDYKDQIYCYSALLLYNEKD